MNEEITKFESEFEDLELKLEFAGVRLPQILLEDELYSNLKLNNTASNLDVLVALCREGYLEKREAGKLVESKFAEYGERVKQELAIIAKLKFVDYFLIIWDVINFCKKNKIAVGLGRGSCAGSLIFYLIGVTGVDPLKYGLLFERFISPSRSKYQEIGGAVYLSGSIPDVDLDISDLDRYKVVEYLEKKYPNKTAKILNFSTLTGKTLIKEVGKLIYEKSEHEMKEVADLIPVVFGVVTDIEETYKSEPRFKSWCDAHPRAYQIALKLRDLIKHKSVHASGLAMSYDNITENCPIERAKDGQIVCSFNMNDVGETLIKIDLLGLKTLSIVDGVCKDIGIEMGDIDYEDPDIYKFICNTDHFYGLFQIGDNTAYTTTKRLKPENINDMSAIMALARPGGLQSITKYIEAKKRGEPDKLDPSIDHLLKDTWGQMIYQETLMVALSTIGFSLEEGYQAIKIVGKKQIEKVKEWEAKIYKKAEENKVPKATATKIWDVLNASASYSFNRCLSPDTVVDCDGGFKLMDEIRIGDSIDCYDTKTNTRCKTQVVDKIESEAVLYQVEFADGTVLKCSMEHKILCSDLVMRPLKEIIAKNLEVCID